MAKRGKKYKKIVKENKVTTGLSLEQAVKEVKKLSYSKFKGTIALHVALHVPKDKDAKSIKGAVSLPFSSAEKEINIIAFVQPEKVKSALEAGASKAGLEDLIKEVQSGSVNFDVAIAEPSVMPKIAVLGKVLGPKGLMPNPKTGTVAENVVAAIEEYKKGKLNFASDETGVIHIPIGKIDLDDEKMNKNARTAINAVAEVLNKTPKSIIKTLFLAPTMGPSIKVVYEDESES